MMTKLAMISKGIMKTHVVMISAIGNPIKIFNRPCGTFPASSKYINWIM